MLEGRNIVELAREVERRANDKRDFVADTRSMSMIKFDGSGSVGLNIDGTITGLGLTDHTHRQIGTHLKVPAQFYDRLRSDHQDLLVQTVNTLLHREPTRRTVRVLDGNARAFLSDRYRVIDHEDVLEAVLPAIADVRAEIVSSEVTMSRLYVKALFPKLHAEVTRGDVVQAGLLISNSEIGLGALRIEPLIYRLVCMNGMVRQDNSFRRNHVGRASGDGEGARELFRDDTLRQDDKAFLMKVRDVVSASLTEAAFAGHVKAMRESTERKLEGDVPAAVEVIKKRSALTDSESSSVLRHLISGGDLSQWGLANAVTAMAHVDTRDFDRSVELERVGGSIIDMSPSEWREVANAA